MNNCKLQRSIACHERVFTVNQPKIRIQRHHISLGCHAAPLLLMYHVEAVSRLCILYQEVRLRRADRGRELFGFSTIFRPFYPLPQILNTTVQCLETFAATNVTIGQSDSLT